jgi:hypothetical protein
MMMNVAGSSLIRYGKSHGLAVAGGDMRTDVANGQWTLNAAYGVNITAGSDALASDLTLTAYNYISQKAYGPLDEITYGNSYKNVHGDSFEMFQGRKQTWVMDAEVSGKMAASLTFFFGLSSTIKLAAELNLTVAASATVKMSAEVSLSLTAKADIIFGIDFKMVTGTAQKVINGQDTSVVDSGLKYVVGNDAKIVGVYDMKIAFIDTKDVEFKLDKVGVDLGSKDLDSKYSGLKSRVEQVRSQLHDINSRAVALETIL